MESTQGYSISLLNLPVELLHIIISYIPEKRALIHLSVTNKLFRVLCASHLFQTLNIPFSMAGFNCLLQASQSWIAPYVKSISYEAYELVDPRKSSIKSPVPNTNRYNFLVAMDWDSFRSYLYTPAEYVRDRRDLWTSRGRGVTYSKVYSYFCARCREQQEILRTDRDIITLCASLPRFANLRAIHMRFGDGIPPPFRWFSGRVLLDGPLSFGSHLEKMATAMIVAKKTGISISEFRITGFYPRVASEDPCVWDLTAEALSNVEELHVIDSPAMMECLVPIPLPRLRRLELGSCWLSCAHLEAFVYAHASTLRFLHLEDIWLLQVQNDADGVRLSLASAKSVLQSLSRVRRSGILQELTINRRQAGHYEVHEVFDKAERYLS